MDEEKFVGEEDVSQWVFSPWQTATAGTEYVAQLEEHKDRAVHFPVAQIDGYFAPVLPGQTVAILAKSQNYKSGFINFWEHHLAQQLVAKGRQHEVIVHVDTEHTLEELALGEISRASGVSISDLSRGNVSKWGDVIAAAEKINGVEIYRIANRLGEERGPDLHLSNVYKAIKALASGKVLGRKVTIAGIFLDYLQALPIDPVIAKSNKNIEKQRRLQVREDTYRLKRMGQKLVCPVFAGVQAKQILTGTLGPTMLIPGLYDGEETSAIAQRFGRSIGLWMVKNDFAVGDTINHKGLSYPVTDNLLMIRVLKQQGGLPSGRRWACDIDHRTGLVTAQGSAYAVPQQGYNGGAKQGVR